MAHSGTETQSRYCSLRYAHAGFWGDTHFAKIAQSQRSRLYFGIAYMKEGFEAFKVSIDITQFSMGGIKGLLIYTLIGNLSNNL